MKNGGKLRGKIRKLLKNRGKIFQKNKRKMAEKLRGKTRKIPVNGGKTRKNGWNKTKNSGEIEGKTNEKFQKNVGKS